MLRSLSCKLLQNAFEHMEEKEVLITHASKGTIKVNLEQEHTQPAGSVNVNRLSLQTTQIKHFFHMVKLRFPEHSQFP